MSLFRLALRNLSRNRIRVVMTSAAMIFTVMLVALLLTMPTGLESILEEGSSDVRVSVHSEAGLAYPMPLHLAHRIREVDGVEAAVAMSWFDGAYEEDGRVTFPSFGVEPDRLSGVYPDYPITDQALEEFEKTRSGALVGDQLMKKYNWKLGDRITLRGTLWPIDLELQIVGRIEDGRAYQLWFDRSYLDEGLKQIGWSGLDTASLIWVRVDGVEQVSSVISEIDRLSQNSGAPTAAETEKSFMQQFFGSLKSFLSLLLAVTGILSLSVLLIFINSAALSIRERVTEVGVLRALGFHPNSIILMLVGESAILAFVSGGIGVALALLVSGGLEAAAGWSSEAIGILGHFSVTAVIVGQVLGFSLFVGILAGVMPAFSATRRPVCNALREAS